jgi:hypothetical protein
VPSIPPYGELLELELELCDDDEVLPATVELDDDDDVLPATVELELFELLLLDVLLLDIVESDDDELLELEVLPATVELDELELLELELDDDDDELDELELFAAMPPMSRQTAAPTVWSVQMYRPLSVLLYQRAPTRNGRPTLAVSPLSLFAIGFVVL